MALWNYFSRFRSVNLDIRLSVTIEYSTPLSYGKSFIIFTQNFQSLLELLIFSVYILVYNHGMWFGFRFWDFTTTFTYGLLLHCRRSLVAPCHLAHDCSCVNNRSVPTPYNGYLLSSLFDSSCTKLEHIVYGTLGLEAVWQRCGMRYTARCRRFTIVFVPETWFEFNNLIYTFYLSSFLVILLSGYFFTTHLVLSLWGFCLMKN